MNITRTSQQRKAGENLNMLPLAEGRLRNSGDKMIPIAKPVIGEDERGALRVVYD
jgi:hypothetical protein